MKEKEKRKNMIIVADRVGGLGNQLFQYTAACAIASHHPTSQILIGQEKNNPHNHSGHDYARLLMKRAIVINDEEETKLCMENQYCQPTSFTPWEPKDVQLPVRMRGYFQYYPAVQQILPELLTELRIALRPFCQIGICEEKCVFMHVRRGDYLLSPDYFHIQTKDYYENAFSVWRQTFPHEDFQVFLITNDVDWCQCQEWSFPFTIYHEPDEVRVLAFMSQCKAGAVIANSTFSYWGALLSGTKHVFYPEKWVAEPIYELCPSNWLCVRG